MNTSFLSDPIAALLGGWSMNLNVPSILFRTIVAVVLSAIIGCERASKRHSAGLRTFILVMAAGMNATILDLYLWDMTGRGMFLISAAAVVAISVLSINSIVYSSRNEIKGLTTAAALWETGIIGMSLGAGCYTMTLVSFLVLMCTLSWFPTMEAYLKNRSNHFELHLELRDSHYLQDFVTTIRRLGLTIDDIEQNPAYLGSGLSVYSISVSISSAELKKYKTHTEIIEALKTLEYVYHIEEMHV